MCCRDYVYGVETVDSARALSRRRRRWGRATDGVARWMGRRLVGGRASILLLLLLLLHLLRPEPPGFRAALSAEPQLVFCFIATTTIPTHAIPTSIHTPYPLFTIHYSLYSRHWDTGTLRHWDTRHWDTWTYIRAGTLSVPSCSPASQRAS